MRVTHTTADAISFNTVLAALANLAGYTEKAEKLLTTMLDAGFDADTRSFTAVIVAFARASRPQPAAKWLDRMLQTGLQPDTVTFNAVLLAHANAGDCEGAFRVLAKVDETARADCPNARPDVISYNSLLAACAKAGKPQRAEAAFAHMEKRGIAPTAVTYSTVLSAHSRAGSPANAQSWLERSIAAGFPPDAISVRHAPCDPMRGAHAARASPRRACSRRARLSRGVCSSTRCARRTPRPVTPSRRSGASTRCAAPTSPPPPRRVRSSSTPSCRRGAQTRPSACSGAPSRSVEAAGGRRTAHVPRRSACPRERRRPALRVSRAQGPRRHE